MYAPRCLTRGETVEAVGWFRQSCGSRGRAIEIKPGILQEAIGDVGGQLVHNLRVDILSLRFRGMCNLPVESAYGGKNPLAERTCPQMVPDR